MIEIRKATDADWHHIWPIVNEVFARGDTCAFSPDTAEKQGYTIWIGLPKSTYAAVSSGEILGTY